MLFFWEYLVITVNFFKILAVDSCFSDSKMHCDLNSSKFLIYINF